MDCFHILTAPPPPPSEFPKCITSPCPWISIILPPPFKFSIRISCDVRVYTRKLLRLTDFRFRHLEFEPSGSAVAPNPMRFKFNGVLSQKDHVSLSMVWYGMDIFWNHPLACWKSLREVRVGVWRWGWGGP